MAAVNHHPTLSRNQLVQYASRIYECPAEKSESQLQELEGLITRDPLRGLTVVQQRHLATVPFSNVVLHYSQHHTISLDPDVLFHKLIQRGLGGYCVENSGLFAIILRSLGYKLYTGGAKVCREVEGGPAGEFNGWSHMVIIVTIGEDRYMVDVGFGPNGPTCPIPLKNDQPCPRMAPGEQRLLSSNIQCNADSGQKLWVYQFRYSPGDGWTTGYAFSELEFSRADYEIMNFFTSQHPTSIFIRNFITAKFLLNETKDGIIGTLMIVKDAVKQNLGGKTDTLRTLSTEGERIDTLAKDFNLHLQPMEIRGIRNMGSQLR